MRNKTAPGVPRVLQSSLGIAVATVGLSIAGTAGAANCSDPPVSGNKYFIVNTDSGLQLDVAQASKYDGATVLQWPATGAGNQQWTLTELSKGVWTMVAAHSNAALDLYGWDTSEDAPIKQWSYFGNANQQWLISASGDAYTVASNSSKKLLTVADKSAGTVVKQHSQGSGLQRWYFNRVDGKCSSGTTASGSFGSFMGRTKILIGGGIDEDTLKAAPFDVTYAYIHSKSAPYAQCYDKCLDGCNSNGWWGCWGASQWDNSSGIQITWHNAHPNVNSAGGSIIQEWTWYSAEDMGIAQGDLEKKYAGTDGSPDYKGAINNQTLLKGYLDDYRFFLQKIGTTANMIHLEPDFWGFIRVTSGDHPNDPHYVPAQVQSANATDCASEENSAAGLVSCLIKMTRKYATKSTVGLHVTCWDWAEDETATRGIKACTEYYKKLGASQGDFLATDVTDRDAAWAERNMTGGKSYWWDDTKWAKYVAQLKTMTEAIGKPIELWQVPLGNMNLANYDNHWQDNKVWYIFNRMTDLQNAHVFSIQFGAGESHQTGTTTDGGYMLQYAKQYYNMGGVPMK